MIKGITSHIQPLPLQRALSPQQPTLIPVTPQPLVQDNVRVNTLKGAVPVTNVFAHDGSDTVKAALAKLHSSPTQENFRNSQASFRVALRSLDKAHLLQAQHAVTAEMQKTSDYRTQVFLDEILVDVKMEIFWRDRDNKSFQHDYGVHKVEDALAALQSSPTQENFRKAQAGFRVAIRSLSSADLDQAEIAVKAHMQKTDDYRTQVFLDKLLTDVKMERFGRTLKS